MRMVNHKLIKLKEREVIKMRKIYVAFVFFVAFLVSNFANAVVSEKDVENFIKNMGTQSQEILNNSKLNEKQKEAEYKKFAESIVDSNWVARFILGNHWRELTPAQRDEFQNLYKEYLLGNYMPKLKDYNKDLNIEKIVKQKEKVYMVSTKTKDINDRVVNVNFRVIEKNDKLYITDIIPEGISFIGSQRSDINSSINTNGYDKFIKQLKDKINSK